MQNQYVGDIGDFGKYGLLRALAGDPLRLGVIWYLFPDEPPKDPNKPDNRDGSLTDYLYDKRDNHEKYRKCDTELYDELRRIVIQEKKRDVTRIRESGILLWDTVYYENSLSYPRKQPMPLRKSIRESWLEGTLAATAKADVVFVDPDNGIAPENISAWRKNGPKYVFMDDLNRFYCNGKSLVIYQHLTRQCKAPEQINKLAKRLQESLKLPHMPWSLWYHRGTARAYFIVAQERHRAVLEKRLASFADSPWCAKPLSHFELVKPSEG